MPSYLSYKNNLRAALDAKDDNIEAWITVRGNHIPIMKGQSKEEAVKSFLAKKSDKESSARSNKPESVGTAAKRVVKQTEENRKTYKEATNTRKLENGGFTKGLTKKEHAKVEAHNKNVSSLAKEIKKNDNEAVEKHDRIWSGKGTKEEVAQELKSIENIFGKNDSTTKNAKEKFSQMYGDDFYSDESYVKRLGVTEKYIELENEREGLRNEIVMANRRGRTEEVKKLREEQKNLEKRTTEEVGRINKIKESIKGGSDDEPPLTVLEIAYNDVDFGGSPKQNREAMITAIKHSGLNQENTEILHKMVESMPDSALKDIESFRKGVKKAYNVKDYHDEEERQVAERANKFNGEIKKFNSKPYFTKQQIAAIASDIHKHSMGSSYKEFVNRVKKAGIDWDAKVEEIAHKTNYRDMRVELIVAMGEADAIACNRDI